MTNQKIDLALFNRETDPSETNDLAPMHPEVVARLQEPARKAREELRRLRYATERPWRGILGF